ncbi:hypothetical protein CDL12_03154 [Handroanthus impetiginosus]|uniref:Wall-associated receptor kinase galacturonan-binding domain-containing protein n=1 Tax=Handroanthus impetiginosus TaxID=429701 RepID=A0A2G9I2W4_9LAMI|nr:hypothetical protein CDL12_03154 [Handroanthus impetiginosus]
MPSHFLLTLAAAVLLTAAYSQPPTTTTTTYPNCNCRRRPPHCNLSNFALACRNNTTTELTNGSLTYRVLQLDQTQNTLILSRSDLYNDTCPSEFHNTTLNSTLFSSDGLRNEVLNLFYGCDTTAMNMTPYNLFSCNSSGLNFTDAYYLIGPVPLTRF